MAIKLLVCTQCGFVGNSKTAIEGNFLIEIILWLCFIIPGLIYSIWRSFSRYDVCPQCGNPSLIPSDSPRGKKLVEESISEEEMTNIMEIESKRSKKKSLRKGIIITLVIICVLIIIYN